MVRLLPPRSNLRLEERPLVSEQVETASTEDVVEPAISNAPQRIPLRIRFVRWLRATWWRLKNNFGFIWRHGRPCLFAALTIVCVGLGIYFRVTAHATSPKIARSSDSIELFVSDPNAQAKLAVTAFSTLNDNEDHAYATVQLGVIPSNPGENVRWAIRYRGYPNQLEIDRPDIFLKTLPDHGRYIRQESGVLEQVTLITGDMHSLDKPLPNYLSGDLLRPDMVEVANLNITNYENITKYEERGTGEYSAHLPGIQNNWSYLPLPLIVEQSQILKKPIAMVYEPVQTVPEVNPNGIHPIGPNGMPLPESYIAKMPGTDPIAYFRPKNLDITEALTTADTVMTNSQVTSMVPLDGQLQGTNLVWRSTGPLEPSISTTTIAYQEQKSTNDFYAGLAFATSAAAFIALVQELPRPEKPQKKTEASPKARRDPESPSDQPPRQT
jgi:hypothetical protein